jgi:hypothetical protein
MANDCSHGVDEERRGGGALTSAQVHTWPAWRGSARVADQARPGVVFTGGGVAAQGASTGEASTSAVHPPQPPQERTTSTTRVTGVASSSEATRAGGNRVRDGKGSPQRGGVRQIHLVEEAEGSGARRLPQMAVAEVGGGRRRSPEAA